MKDFFVRLFGEKSTTSKTSVTTNLPHTVTTVSTGPVTLVWHRNAQGKPTGSGVEFPADGERGTMFAGPNAEFGASMFCMGAVLRRSLNPWTQRKAARWAGARFTEDGDPIWDLESEQRFAEAYVEYTNENSEPGDTKALVPMNLGRPSLTDEMRQLFEDPYQEEPERGTP